MTQWPQQIQDLPITQYLDSICTSIKESPNRFLILQAQTAAGKSTALPIALLKNFSGNILMLEQRRLAAIAIANRVADILGEECGNTAGYTLHLDSCTSSNTRFEVITEAILNRRLQKDPGLDGINVIVIDEFHERSIHSDLALAFLRDVMEIRDDLYVIIMSATMDCKALSSYLDNAPVIEIPGRQYPVTIEYEPTLSLCSIIDNNIFNKSFSGSVLIFFAGIYEINKAKNDINEYFGDSVEILILHSSVSLSEQKKVLTPNTDCSKTRIILSSAIAETSLTVPDVTLVIDTGKARINRLDIATGMQKLVTENESFFNAQQRSGRAGRVTSGKCIRMWDKNSVLNQQNSPEILRADLSQLVLECYKWGVKNADSLKWLDKPSPNMWASAVELLFSNNLIDKNGITKSGEAALLMGLSPRLACVAIQGIFHNQTEDAIDIILQYSEYAQSTPAKQKAFCDNLRQRLKHCGLSSPDNIQHVSKGILLLSGYTDRLALKESGDSESSVYQLSTGRKAVLKQNCSLSPKWIVAPVADAGETTGKIYSYTPLSENEVVQWLQDKTSTTTTSFFEDKKIVKYETTSYGKIILKKIRLSSTPEDYKDAVCNEVSSKGIEWLPIDDKIKSLILRSRFYGERKDCLYLEKLDSLSQKCKLWLQPFITGNSISSNDVYNGLYWYLDGSQIDKNVPVEIILDNGKKQKIIYENLNGTVTPVIEAIIQRLFGCFKTPKILDTNVLLRLLSPARRPLQITQDLEGFWSGSWIEICKEMKGRYPKHNWDYRISEKE